jgi:hypothetical protein
MELRDLVVTPIIIFLAYAGAYFVRPYLTDAINRKYYFPALTLRIAGAIALGFVYQFYYEGGDTYNYHTLGSRVVWEYFVKDPFEGLRLIFGVITDDLGVYKYSSKIIFFRDSSSYFVIRIAAFFDLFTFSSYSATAVLFGALSFFGSWAFFITFYRRYPHLHLPLAIASFFVPSLFFWGSGILKDTVSLAALGFATYLIDGLFIRRKWSFMMFVYLLLSLFIIYQVRKFILQAFIPTALIWIFFKYLMLVRSVAIRILIFPAIIALLSYLAFLSIVKVGEGDKKYSVNNLAKTAKITAYDIGFFTGHDAGSGYSLGELDGTFANMIQKAPAAINVSLFRPYLWEVKNPLMLLAAMESLALIFFTFSALFSRKTRILASLKNPDVVFLLTFSLIMAFAVGITSYNFGTLSRYRIPVLPFFLTTVVIMKSGVIRNQIFSENKDQADEQLNKTQ